MAERVGFRPDTNDNTATMFRKHNSSKRVDDSRTRFGGNSRFRLPKRSELIPVRYIKHLGNKVASVLRFGRRKAAPTDVSSSGKAKPFVAPTDSHRAEAIHDCIKFINTSSSLQKSNSVSY